VIAKAWDHVERIGARAHWQPCRALVTGAGPIGLLAALFARQRGLAVTVVDRVTEGPKPGLVRDLGAAYHVGPIEELAESADVVLECTGAAALLFAAIERARPNGIVCLTGVSSRGRLLRVDAAALNRELVLENNVVFGTVNANRAHYERAAAALARADHAWLARLLTRQVPLARWSEAFTRGAGDVKPIVRLA
jgi:threonine dehydrogenase-like Zn-dependent dehydrogenase